MKTKTGTFNRAPAFIDPPGPFAPLEEWIVYRDELHRSGIPGIAPYIREADCHIARLLAEQG
jgi:hypothetical protein